MEREMMKYVTQVVNEVTMMGAVSKAKRAANAERDVLSSKGEEGRMNST